LLRCSKLVCLPSLECLVTSFLKLLLIKKNYLVKRAILLEAIEIGLEHAPFVVLVYFFSSFEHAKNLLIMGPNNTKNSSLKVDFLIFNYE
jgi:hypothetical protein